jgi:hypothetical protein
MNKENDRASRDLVYIRHLLRCVAENGAPAFDNAKARRQLTLIRAKLDQLLGETFADAYAAAQAQDAADAAAEQSIQAVQADRLNDPTSLAAAVAAVRASGAPETVENVKRAWDQAKLAAGWTRKDGAWTKPKGGSA